MDITKERVLASIETVTDPELGINVVDLGLIYNVLIEDAKISVDMTLTSPGCPMAAMIASDVELAIREAFETMDVEVSIVWDPPWTPERLSPTGRTQLGYDA